MEKGQEQKPDDDHNISERKNDTDKVENKNNLEAEKEIKEKIHIHQMIKKTLDEFLSHFVRLSGERCAEICIATIQSVYYLLKGKANRMID